MSVLSKFSPTPPTFKPTVTYPNQPAVSPFLTPGLKLPDMRQTAKFGGFTQNSDLNSTGDARGVSGFVPKEMTLGGIDGIGPTSVVDS